MNGSLLDYLAVAVLGALVGAAELVSRYRDAPARAVYNLPAAIYIALNLAASIAALAIIHVYGWTFGVNGAAAQRWAQVGMAGTSAMALFRTSLFTLRAGDHDIGIGPSTFLQIFREASDRAVDRLRAKARGDQVGKWMTGVDYDKASRGLPTYCLALMQNVPDDEQVKLMNSIALLNNANIDPAIKVRILGLQLMNVVGPNVLLAAVDSLHDQMQAAEIPKAGAKGAGN
jgi:hypothetical protein